MSEASRVTARRQEQPFEIERRPITCRLTCDRPIMLVAGNRLRLRLNLFRPGTGDLVIRCEGLLRCLVVGMCNDYRSIPLVPVKKCQILLQPVFLTAEFIEIPCDLWNLLSARIRDQPWCDFELIDAPLMTVASLLGEK